MTRRGERELEGDVRLVANYGISHPESYGGVRLDDADFPGPVRLVVAFTSGLDRHLAALQSVAENNDRLDVRSCPLSHLECKELGDRVQGEILSSIPDIETLATVDSVWSGVLVLVNANQVGSVRAIVGETGGFESRKGDTTSCPADALAQVGTWRRISVCRRTAEKR